MCSRCNCNQGVLDYEPDPNVVEEYTVTPDTYWWTGVGSNQNERSERDIKLQQRWCPSRPSQHSSSSNRVRERFTHSNLLPGVGLSSEETKPGRNRTKFDMKQQAKSKSKR